MTVRIELSSIFTIESGRSGWELEIPAAEMDLKDLLARIADRLEGSADQLIFSHKPQEINPGLMVKWNDKVLTGLQINSRSHMVRDGDALTLLYVISGG